MSMRAPIVALERRGRLQIGVAVGEAAGGGRRLRVLGEGNETFRVAPERVLHCFSEIAADDERDLRRAARAFRDRIERAAAAEVDLRGLWSALEPGRGYTLAELAAAGHRDGAADEAACERVLGALLGDATPLFELRGGRFVGRPPEQVAEDEHRERVRRAREDEDERLLAWLGELAARPAEERAGAAHAVAPDLEEALAALRDWALRGEEGGPARGRRLASRLGAESPDHALEQVEALGVVERDVNELPLRAALPLRPTAAERNEAISQLVAPLAAGERTCRREPPALSIDAADTDEIDDAIALVPREGGGLRVLVHIADVAASVPLGGAVDAGARRRLQTVYFADGKIPMLPPELVAGRLSLEPGVERAAVTLVADFDAEHELVAARFERSIVRSARRVSYEESEERLGSDPELDRLHALARALLARRLALGAVAAGLSDLRVSFDAAGAPRITPFVPSTPGHLIVSELMVLYNEQLARRLVAAGAGAVFRVQPEPIEREMPDRSDPLFSLRVRRLLRPAAVSLDPGPHRSVGADVYAQGSSPIRRYVDLVAQRQLLAVLAGEPPPYDRRALGEVRDALLARERALRALEAERTRFWALRVLEREGAEALEAVVSRPPNVEGRGMCFVPRLLSEEPFDIEPDEAGLVPHVALAAGDPIRPRIAALAPRRRALRLRLSRPRSPDAE